MTLHRLSCASQRNLPRALKKRFIFCTDEPSNSRHPGQGIMSRPVSPDILHHEQSFQASSQNSAAIQTLRATHGPVPEDPQTVPGVSQTGAHQAGLVFQGAVCTSSGCPGPHRGQPEPEQNRDQQQCGQQPGSDEEATSGLSLFPFRPGLPSADVHVHARATVPSVHLAGTAPHVDPQLSAANSPSHAAFPYATSEVQLSAQTAEPACPGVYSPCSPCKRSACHRVERGKVYSSQIFDFADHNGEKDERESPFSRENESGENRRGSEEKDSSRENESGENRRGSKEKDSSRENESGENRKGSEEKDSSRENESGENRRGSKEKDSSRENESGENNGEQGEGGSSFRDNQSGAESRDKEKGESSSSENESGKDYQPSSRKRLRSYCVCRDSETSITIRVRDVTHKKSQRIVNKATSGFSLLASQTEHLERETSGSCAEKSRRSLGQRKSKTTVSEESSPPSQERVCPKISHTTESPYQGNGNPTVFTPSPTRFQKRAHSQVHPTFAASEQTNRRMPDGDKLPTDSDRKRESPTQAYKPHPFASRQQRSEHTQSQSTLGSRYSDASQSKTANQTGDGNSGISEERTKVGERSTSPKQSQDRSVTPETHQPEILSASYSEDQGPQPARPDAHASADPTAGPFSATLPAFAQQTSTFASVAASSTSSAHPPGQGRKRRKKRRLGRTVQEGRKGGKELSGTLKRADSPTSSASLKKPPTAPQAFESCSPGKAEKIKDCSAVPVEIKTETVDTSYPEVDDFGFQDPSRQLAFRNDSRKENGTRNEAQEQRVQSISKTPRTVGEWSILYEKSLPYSSDCTDVFETMVDTDFKEEIDVDMKDITKDAKSDIDRDGKDDINKDNAKDSKNKTSSHQIDKDSFQKEVHPSTYFEQPEFDLKGFRKEAEEEGTIVPYYEGLAKSTPTLEIDVSSAVENPTFLPNTTNHTTCKDKRIGGRRKQKTPRPFRKKHSLSIKHFNHLTDQYGAETTESNVEATQNKFCTSKQNVPFDPQPNCKSSTILQTLIDASKSVINPTQVSSGYKQGQHIQVGELTAGKTSENGNSCDVQGLQPLRFHPHGLGTSINASHASGNPKTSSISRQTSETRSFDYRSHFVPQKATHVPSQHVISSSNKVSVSENEGQRFFHAATVTSSVRPVTSTPVALVRVPYVPVPVHCPTMPAMPAVLPALSSRFQSQPSTVPLVTTAGLHVTDRPTHHSYIPIVPKMPITPATLPVWALSYSIGSVAKEEVSSAQHISHRATNTTTNRVPASSGQQNQAGEANNIMLQGRTPQLGIIRSQMSPCTGSIPVLIFLPNLAPNIPVTHPVQTHPMNLAEWKRMTKQEQAKLESHNLDTMKVNKEAVLDRDNVTNKFAAHKDAKKLGDEKLECSSHRAAGLVKTDSPNEESKSSHQVFRPKERDSSEKKCNASSTEDQRSNKALALSSKVYKDNNTPANLSNTTSKIEKESGSDMKLDNRKVSTKSVTSADFTSTYFPFQYDACKRAEEIVYSSPSSFPSEDGDGRSSNSTSVLTCSESPRQDKDHEVSTDTMSSKPPLSTEVSTNDMSVKVSHFLSVDTSTNALSKHVSASFEGSTTTVLTKQSTAVEASTWSTGPGDSFSATDASTNTLQSNLTKSPTNNVSAELGVSKSGRKRKVSTRYDFQTNSLWESSDKEEDITPITSDDEWIPDKDKDGQSSEDEDKPHKKDSFMDLLYPANRTKTQRPAQLCRHNSAAKLQTREPSQPPRSSFVVEFSSFKQTPSQTYTVTKKPFSTPAPKTEQEILGGPEPKQKNHEELEMTEDDNTNSFSLVNLDHELKVKDENQPNKPSHVAFITTQPDSASCLRKRRKTPYTKEELTCRLCNKIFVNIYRLKRHEFSHGDIRPYKCDQCGKAFKQSGHRNEHRLTHSTNKRSFLCNECGVVITSRSSFRYHVMSHKQLGSGTVRTANCQISSAGEGGQSPSHPNLTPETLHSSQEERAKGDALDSVMGLKEAGSGVSSAAYDCPHCVLRFATAQSLNCHLETHQEVELRCHVQPFTCGECGRSFTYRHNLDKHRECHHMTPENKRADLYQLRVQQAIAEGKPHFSCNTCGKVYLRKETLTKHMKTHLGIKPFQCGECSKSFTQKIHLTVHSRLHTGSRPFQCRTCRCCFLDSTALARHVARDVCKSEGFTFNVGKRGRKPYHQAAEDKVKAIVKANREQRQRKESATLKCGLCGWTGKYQGCLRRHVQQWHPAQHYKASMMLKQDSTRSPSALTSSCASVTSPTLEHDTVTSGPVSLPHSHAEECSSERGIIQRGPLDLSVNVRNYT